MGTSRLLQGTLLFLIAAVLPFPVTLLRFLSSNHNVINHLQQIVPLTILHCETEGKLPSFWLRLFFPGVICFFIRNDQEACSGRCPLASIGKNAVDAARSGAAFFDRPVDVQAYAVSFTVGKKQDHRETTGAKPATTTYYIIAAFEKRGIDESGLKQGLRFDS